MSLYSTVANYGGRQPDNQQGIKQFVVGSSNGTVTWIYKRVNGMMVQTPADTTKPVYIQNDLYVTGSIYNPSDALLKENIVPIGETTVDKLSLLSPVHFQFKTDPLKKPHCGFIAQQVAEVYPHLVTSSEGGYKAVNYVGFVPILVAKMQSMQKEIDDLKERLAKLET